MAKGLKMLFFLGKMAQQISTHNSKIHTTAVVKKHYGFKCHMAFLVWKRPLGFFSILKGTLDGLLSGVRGAPQFLKKTLREMQGQMKILRVGFAAIPGITPRAESENCGFRIAQVVRRHSENGISYSENSFPNSESCSEEYLATLPELRESPFHSEERFS